MPADVMRRHYPKLFQEFLTNQASADAAEQYARAGLLELAPTCTRVVAFGVGFGLSAVLATMVTDKVVDEACVLADDMWSGGSHVDGIRVHLDHDAFWRAKMRGNVTCWRRQQWLRQNNLM